ncbi:putative nucleotidyltransferase, ribonuclease H [Tanacetum coccineum]
MSDDDANGAESPPRGVDSYYRPGNFEDPSPIVYPAAANGAVSNFKIQPNLIAILPVFRGREEPYAHLREFFSIADTYQVNNTTKDGEKVSQVSHDACSMCGDPGHSVNNCQNWGAPSNEEVNGVYGNRPRNDPFSESYNPGWRNHPNFRWKDDDNYNRHNNTQQQYHGYKPRYEGGDSSNFQQNSYQQRPQQYQNHGQGPSNGQQSNVDQKFDLILSELAKSNQGANLKFESLSKSVVNLERQMGQLAEEVHKREAGKLPSYPTLNPKHKPDGPEHVNMVTSLRNGKTYNNDIKIPSVHDFSHEVEDFVTDDEIVVEGKKADNVKSDSELVNDLLKDFPKPPTQNPKATESPKTDRSTKIPRGILEDVIVKVDDFYYPVDFFVMDTESPYKDVQPTIILGRPFLATIDARINCRTGAMDIAFGNKKLRLNVFNSVNSPTMNECYQVDVIDEEVQKHTPRTLKDDPLDFYLTGENEEILNVAEVQEIQECLVSSLDHQRPPWSNNTLPVIVASDLSGLQEEALLNVLSKYKAAVGWTIADLKGISPSLCMHRIVTDPDVKPSRDAQRRLNPNMKEVVKKEVLKWLDAGIIYPISDSKWVSPTQTVPKKAGITVVETESGEKLTTRPVTGWRVCIDYRKLNNATSKDHFPLPFIDQIVEKLSGQKFYCFLDGYSGYNQIPIHPDDQAKTTFTCPYGTFAFRRMPFGLCNAPATFQRCMMSIFSDMVGESVEIFMDDFSIFGQSFESCLGQLESVLKRCIETNLVLSWEKSHFMVREGIVLGHVVSEKGFEVDRAKQSILHKQKLVEAPISASPDWSKPSEKIPCFVYASDSRRGRIIPPPFNPSDVIKESFPDESLFEVSKLPWRTRLMWFIWNHFNRLNSSNELCRADDGKLSASREATRGL